MKTYTQDPSSKLDYAVDWTAFLDGATIVSSTWTTTLTVTGEANTASLATAFISGGTLGTTYDVKNTITASDGRIDARTFQIRLEQTAL